MANSTTAFNGISNNILLCSIVFKFIAMIIGILGNVTVIIYTIFSSKEKTATTYLIGNLALADLLVCLAFYPIWIVELTRTILNIDSNQVIFCKLSRSTIWAFILASVTTLLAITIDRYIYFVKPLKYPLIVTHRRVFLAVSSIWVTACCLFLLVYIYIRPFGQGFRSFCHLADGIAYALDSLTGYIPLALIFFINFQIISVVRKQQKRILAETNIIPNDNCYEDRLNRMRFVFRFFVALREAKTFAIVVTVLTFCVLIPNVVAEVLYKFCSESCSQTWVVLFNFDRYGINSIVNAFIYGIRHVKYRKAYAKMLSELLHCGKPAI